MGQPPEFQPSESSSGTADTTHLWRGIHDEIVRGILSGQYPPGSLLPSNAQIQQRYGVSSTTSRRVLAELASGGWAISQGTRGYIATAGHDVQYRLGDVLREAQAPTEVDPNAPANTPPEGAAQPVPPQWQQSPGLPRPHHTVPVGGAIPDVLTTVIDVSVRAEPAPAEVAHALALSEPGTPVLVRRHLLADSTGMTPIELWTAFLPYSDGAPLSEPEPLTDTWPQLLSRYSGEQVTTATSQVEARHPDSYEAYALRLPSNDIVLTRATTYLHGNQPLSFAISVWPARTTRLTVEAHPVT